MVEINIESELEKVFFKNQIVRIEAIEEIIGLEGCYQSHILAIEDFIKSGKEYSIIFEDDFVFEVEEDVVIEAVHEAIEKKSKLFLLSYHSLVINLNLNEKEGYLCKFSNGQMACAYMISKEFAPVLLETFKEGYQLLKTTKQESIYANDQYWKKLQQIEGVYACVPKLGKQQSYYSNIVKEVVDYQGSCMIAIVPKKDNEVNFTEIKEKMKYSPFQYKIFLSSPLKVNDRNVVVVKSNSYYEKIRNALMWINNHKHYKMDYIFKTSSCNDVNFEKIFFNFKICNINKLPYFGTNLFTRLYFTYFNDSYFIHTSIISLLKEENNMEGDEQVGYYIYEKGIVPAYIQ